MSVWISRRLHELLGEVAEEYRSQGANPDRGSMQIADDYEISRAIPFEQIDELTRRGVGPFEIHSIARLRDPRRIASAARLIIGGSSVDSAVERASSGPAA